MKITFMLLGLCLGFHLCAAKAQIVKDPFLDYYQCAQSGGTLGDAQPHYTPQTKVYYFEADFTGDGHKSIFITDAQSRQGPHGFYGWLVYYPLTAGGYQKLGTGVSARRSGPEYIGYIDQIKQFGIIVGTRDSVAAYYLDNGTLKSQAIDLERGHANEEHYPKYFHGPQDNQVLTCTLAQLEQK